MEKDTDKVSPLLLKLYTFASLLVLIIAGAITWEVVARYAFNSPTTWVWTVSRQVFGLFVLVAGIYALVESAHIRIEIFYDRFPRIIKRISDAVNMLLFICFLGAIIWKGSQMAWLSIASKEHARGLFHMPIYPLKALIPIVSLLFVAQRVVKYIKDKGKCI